mgnify:CR=1|jgi:hypothetical protein|tara:strand:- start:108 stop:800 length:693 start_codon:yes stop_codon:yes gene_type:complete
MGYFRELPDLDYQSFLSNRESNDEYLRVKNLFRRNKIRNDLADSFTLFNKYEIVEGARPDTVAEEMYGSAELDWVVLLTAGITNVRDQWPLSNRDLYNYTVKKYGLENINNVHHYETNEIKDSANRLIMSAGKVVDPDFIISYYDRGIMYTNDSTQLGAGVEVLTNVTRAISNSDYEVMKNEEKSSIYLLKPGYIQQLLNDMRTDMLYGKSSEYVTDKLARTENTRKLKQ